MASMRTLSATLVGAVGLLCATFTGCFSEPSKDRADVQQDSVDDTSSTCSLPNATGREEEDGVCVIESCNADFGDCDGLDETGCEEPLTSLSHCGSCGQLCQLDNANAACESGSCLIESCLSGSDNCDGEASNGCELLTTPERCGSCFNDCTALDPNAAMTCNQSSCLKTGCQQGFDDCNDTCVDLQSDVSHCGGCGVDCQALQPGNDVSCVLGQCESQGCAAGFVDCSGQGLTACRPIEAGCPFLYIEAISVTSGGIFAEGDSTRADISADGSIVVFDSYASLVSGDFGSTQDIYVRDRTAGTLVRITDGNGHSRDPTISDDGRFIAFHSHASNLVADDTNGKEDAFVYDRVDQSTVRISNGMGGAQADDISWNAVINTTGSHVTFTSRASNLVPGDTNGLDDIFVYDRSSQSIERVSVATDGTQADKECIFSSISPDGNLVVFESHSNTLISGDTGGGKDIFLRTRNAQSTVRVNVPETGSRSPDANNEQAILSPDGTRILFQSFDSLAEQDLGNDWDIYMRDLSRGTTTLISVNQDGDYVPRTSGRTHLPDISADNTRIVYASDGLFDEGDSNGDQDIFLVESSTGTSQRINFNANFEEAVGGDSLRPRLSGNGRFVIFESDATNLVPGDTNASMDIFLIALPE